MFKLWQFLKTNWLHLIIFFIIAIFLFWPFVKLTEKTGQIIFPSKNSMVNLESLVPPAVKNQNILIFGGDIMLSRTVNSKMEKYQNYNWPLEKISSLFSEADLAIANLESPFLIANDYKVLTGSFSFKANPKSVKTLTLAGFDVLSLANNHILNQGKKGLLDTYQVLNTAGIDYVGPYEHNLVIRESNGINFAFLAYTYEQSKLIANIYDSIEDDISLAKQQADVVIVLMHAGTEYTYQPNRSQIEFAHLAIDNGADLVVGTHPHWPQKVETYQGKTIIYSLGNLVFDQMWSKETGIGLVAKVYFNEKELTNIEYIPIVIKDYGQAEIMSDEQDKNNLLKTIEAN